MSPVALRLTALSGLCLGLGLSACRNADEAAETPTAEPTALTALAVASPTIIARSEPTATPTIDPADQPLYPVESAEIAGVPVPLAATVVEHVAGTADTDARLELAMPDYDEQTIYDWYSEQMPLFGWSDVEDRDGSLVFLHDEQLSDRFADEGLKRTATVLFFTLNDEASWTMIVEEPLGAAEARAEDAGEDEAEETEASDEGDEAGAEDPDAGEDDSEDGDESGEDG